MLNMYPQYNSMALTRDEKVPEQKGQIQSLCMSNIDFVYIYIFTCSSMQTKWYSVVTHMGYNH